MVNNCSLVFPLDRAGVSRSVKQNCFWAECLACWLNTGSPSSIPSPARSLLNTPSVVHESAAGLQVAWGASLLSYPILEASCVCRKVWAEVFWEENGVAEAFRTLHQRKWKSQFLSQMQVEEQQSSVARLGLLPHLQKRDAAASRRRSGPVLWSTLVL